MLREFHRVNGFGPSGVLRCTTPRHRNPGDNNFRSWGFAEDAKFRVSENAAGTNVFDDDERVLGMSIDGRDPRGVEEDEVESTERNGQQVIRLAIQEDRFRECG